MIDRTYDIRSGNNVIARDVSEDNVMMFINSLMDNGYSNILIVEHIEQSDIERMVSEKTAELSEVMTKFSEKDQTNG
jgi:hypothetical protein